MEKYNFLKYKLQFTQAVLSNNTKPGRFRSFFKTLCKPKDIPNLRLKHCIFDVIWLYFSLLRRKKSSLEAKQFGMYSLA
ncbi:MAG: hypothetical protein EAZ57_03095 [Cytophagales bacterium]|nr:MAG: hypothetical protein EAZ67_03560 [Cytophagales bacterium]TAF61744.1 MAG: hypothetical protein EAZ57_03095 [Cytophagales bacterium]